MKAIRKSDGKEIEVRLLEPRQYLSSEEEDGVVLQTVYLEDGLILEEHVNWSAFRREAAKLMLPVTSNWKLTKGTASIAITTNAAVKLAIEYADELIKQLKDEPKKGL